MLIRLTCLDFLFLFIVLWKLVNSGCLYDTHYPSPITLDLMIQHLHERTHAYYSLNSLERRTGMHKTNILSFARIVTGFNKEIKDNIRSCVIQHYFNPNIAHSVVWSSWCWWMPVTFLIEQCMLKPCIYWNHLSPYR